MRASASPVAPSGFAITRRRRAFGLDAPRMPDAERVEAAILAWLAAHAPQVFWLRGAAARDQPMERKASTLVLVLPGGRSVLLRIDVKPDRFCADTLALAEQCRRRGIPLSVVSAVDDVRAALRRLGVESRETRA